MHCYISKGLEVYHTRAVKNFLPTTSILQTQNDKGTVTTHAPIFGLHPLSTYTYQHMQSQTEFQECLIHAKEYVTVACTFPQYTMLQGTHGLVCTDIV